MRFRPILMTSLAFVLGMLPMVLASGPGSASRHSIGTGVFFGMIVAITVGIVLVPFFFVFVNNLKHKVNIKEQLSRLPLDKLPLDKIPLERIKQEGSRLGKFLNKK